MRCPYCGADDDRVVDSRPADRGSAVRRRRACRGCGQRFSTYERAEQAPLTVRKRGGAAEPFDRDKVAAGVAKATKNLPAQTELVGQAVARVEARLRDLGRREVSSEEVGVQVLEALRALDPVAYVRFASVYKGFTSPRDFARELADLERDPASTSPTASEAGAGPAADDSGIPG
ncbi:MAG TPA: transcriptional regulator NrdR [Egibacteraceae bacterium]|nr:transcriptional regulator NrdR [Egibacteraceae bacterium]